MSNNIVQSALSDARDFSTRIGEEINELLASQQIADADIEEFIYMRTGQLKRGRPEEDIVALAKYVADDFLRYGPLQPAIEHPQVSEIMVCGSGRDPKTGKYRQPRVFLEVNGRKYFDPDIVFESEEHLIKVVNKIARDANRTCDDSHPLMDAQLPDGSRVNAVHHSIAIDGQTLNIRKFRDDVVHIDQLIKLGVCTKDMARFLESCVKARVSMVVSGGTGSGKTTLLNALSLYIPKDEYIIVVEDTAELRLPHDHVDRLQARPANTEGEGKVTVHDLVVNALRMYPDRIVVGECRSVEAAEMLQAMQTGHDGSLTTVHANSASGALSRIRTMARAGSGLDRDTVDEQIAEAISLVVHTKKLRSGKRIIGEILAVGHYSDGVISRTLLWGSETKPDDKGNDVVCFKPNGQQPQAIKQKILDAGVAYEPEWFFDEGGY